MVEIRNLMDDYLHGKMSGDLFTQECKRIYQQILASPEKQFVLDCIMAIPFIHELAYCPYSEEELKSQAANFHAVMQGTQTYRYCAFFKLLPPDTSLQEVCSLYNHFDDVELTELCPLFAEHIQEPTTIKDLIYNSICDILSNLDFANVTESDFDYVNCANIASLSQIKERLQRLLSYYLGLNSFFLQISFLPEGCVCYTLT